MNRENSGVSSLLIRAPALLGQGPTLLTSFSFYHRHTGLISKYSSLELGPLRMNSGEPQTTDSNPEPKMDRVSQDTEDQEAGADSPAKGPGQPLLTEGRVGAGIWLSLTVPHQSVSASPFGSRSQRHMLQGC